MALKLHGAIATALVIGAVITASSARTDLVLGFSVQGGPPALTADDPPGMFAIIPPQTSGGVTINTPGLIATSNYPGTAAPGQLISTISLTNSTGAAQFVTITTAVKGFIAPTVPPIDLQEIITGDVTAGTLGYNFLGCADPTNSQTACRRGALHPAALNASGVTAPFSNSGTGALEIFLPTSLSDTVTLTLTPGTSVSLQEITQLAPPRAPLLPAALPLFATDLGALGLLGWRRKQSACKFVRGGLNKFQRRLSAKFACSSVRASLTEFPTHIWWRMQCQA